MRTAFLAVVLLAVAAAASAQPVVEVATLEFIPAGPFKVHGFAEIRNAGDDSIVYNQRANINCSAASGYSKSVHTLFNFTYGRKQVLIKSHEPLLVEANPPLGELVTCVLSIEATPQNINFFLNAPAVLELVP